MATVNTKLTPVLIPGTNITITDNGDHTATIASTGGGGGGTTQQQSMAISSLKI
jgi:hypothetical protein